MDVPVTENREPVPDWAKGMAPPGAPGGMSGPKITDNQRSYLLDLLNKKQVPAGQEGKVDLIVKCLAISSDPEEYGMSKAKASELITWFVARPDRPRAHPAEGQTARLPEVPAGNYAALNPEGILRFYTVAKPTQGQWAGYVFLSVWSSDEKFPIKDRDSKNFILGNIAKDPKAAAELFGQEIGKCGICGRTLTDETSRKIGIGPVCRGKSEWY